MIIHSSNIWWNFYIMKLYQTKNQMFQIILSMLRFKQGTFKVIANRLTTWKSLIPQEKTWLQAYRELSSTFHVSSISYLVAGSDQIVLNRRACSRACSVSLLVDSQQRIPDIVTIYRIDGKLRFTVQNVTRKLTPHDLTIHRPLRTCSTSFHQLGPKHDSSFIKLHRTSTSK